MPSKVKIECQVATSGSQDCPNKPGPGRINNWKPDSISIHIQEYGFHNVELYLCDYHRYVKNRSFTANIQKK